MGNTKIHKTEVKEEKNVKKSLESENAIKKRKHNDGDNVNEVGKVDKKMKMKENGGLEELFSEGNKEKFVVVKEKGKEKTEVGKETGNTGKEEKVKKRGKGKKQEKPDPPEKLRCTLFVGNLSLKYLEDEKPFLEIFQKYGEIDSHRFRSVPISGVPIEKYDQKVLRKASIIKSAINEEVGSMNAYVVYKDEESVEKALVENGKVYDDHHIRVDKTLPSTHKQEKDRTVFIGNLPFNCTNEELRHYIESHLDEETSEITNLRIIRDENTNQSKGIAYVEFKDPSSIADALLLNNTEFKDRSIRVTKWKAVTKRSDSAPPTNLSKRNNETSFSGEKTRFNSRRGGKSDFESRGGRGGRPFRSRGGRGGRSDFEPRGGRGGRPFESRGGRGGRSDFESRGGRSDFESRGGRGGRPFRSRGGRGGKSDFESRGGRGGRPFRSRGGRGGKSDFESRGGRGGRPFQSRGGRGRKPDF